MKNRAWVAPAAMLSLVVSGSAHGQLFTLTAQNATADAVAADDGFPGDPPSYTFSSMALAPVSAGANLGSAIVTLSTSFSSSAIVASSRAEGRHTIQDYNGSASAAADLTFLLPQPSMLSLTGRNRWVLGGGASSGMVLVGPSGQVPFSTTILFSSSSAYDATHTFSGVLPAGTYRFIGWSSGAGTRLGQPTTGFGEFNATMQFTIPAPSVAAVFLPMSVALLGRRRTGFAGCA